MGKWGFVLPAVSVFTLGVGSEGPGEGEVLISRYHINKERRDVREPKTQSGP